MSTTSSPNASDRVGTFITTLRWSDVPEHVRERTVMAVVDTLAAVIAGAEATSTRIATDYAILTFAPGASTPIADRRRLRAEGAAFANAVAANAYDLDDVSVHTWGHPGAQVVPAALALAEEVDAGGEEFLTAVLIGYEIAARQARCLYADVRPSPERDYRGCGAWGAVAAAASAARLLRLDELQTWEALGIAEYHSPDARILRAVRHPGMVKHGHGPAVLAGITAARLASGGFTGTPGLLGDERFREVISDLGEDYLVEGRGMQWKRFACCAWVHPALHALRSLLERSGGTVEPARISRIVVDAHHDSHLLGARVPATTEEAQFSMAWPLAAYLIDGEVGTRQVDERRMADAAVRELAGHIELRRSDELDRLYFLADADDPEGSEAARVVIELDDGSRLDSGVVALPATEAPWTIGEMRAKFRWATRDVLPADRAEAILETAERVDGLADVRALTALLHEERSRGQAGATPPAAGQEIPRAST